MYIFNSPIGDLLFLLNIQNKIMVYQMKSGKFLQEIKENVNSICMTSDGRRLYYSYFSITNSWVFSDEKKKYIQDSTEYDLGASNLEVNNIGSHFAISTMNSDVIKIYKKNIEEYSLNSSGILKFNPYYSNILALSSPIGEYLIDLDQKTFQKISLEKCPHYLSQITFSEDGKRMYLMMNDSKQKKIFLGFHCFKFFPGFHFEYLVDLSFRFK